jgi:hypothetical protein
MTCDDHKRRLIIVCTCDRLQWTAGVVKRRRRAGQGWVFPEWLWLQVVVPLAIPLAIPLMPRWVRVVWTAARRWTG